MYQKQGKTAYKADLSNTILLTKHLGNPESDFKSVHVGGTNGKGSTSHILCSVLMEAGYKVGLYTSPHLKDFRERIRINGKMIEESYVVNFVEENKSFFEANSLSFFEMTVGMAFTYFRDEKVDIAIIEVGLGGRLDSTNIIEPELAVITNIGYDHMQFLGDTLEKIAAEKAGIIKAGIPVVIGETVGETKPVFNAKAEEQGAKIIFAEDIILNEVPNSDLKGIYQKKNLRTALVALQELRNRFNRINTKNISDGFTNVERNTGLMGRWQVFNNEPLTVADTAHNKEGIMEVVHQINDQSFNQLHLVLGFVNDKNIEELLSFFPAKAQYYFCEPKIARGLPLNSLIEISSRLGLNGTAYDSVSKAFKAAKKQANKEDMIFIGGSTFVVAEVV
ncbi:bifunctional folylpolyglutamate synthase/dihydrofolate synthase [Winogradskyella aurantiaca]|uniref:bifunctional folylpolyglutamate synthase/dihydrofolate synthase n=1 Tax=Winogradskyella aurantiaca TaxID=2219558 RepID=UPI002936E4CB|nr:folylpolyglutamate synthase/dihydrofolate synthase family protein [Winogradskyella aurantiaca]